MLHGTRRTIAVCLLHHHESAPQHVDVLPAEGDQLPGAKAAEATHQYEGSVSRIDRVGETHDLVGFQEARRYLLELRRLHTVQRVTPNSSGCHSSLEATVKRAEGRMHRSC